MSNYYTPQRTKNLYGLNLDSPFKLSRSKIDLFLNCPRCFYLDRKLGIGRPPGFPFALNSAVDELLKKEFDKYRYSDMNHPLLERYALDARPVAHENLHIWRDNFKGIQHHDKETNLLIFGAIDDLWVNSKSEYIVVDYKATSKNEAITELNKDWHIGFKRQIEIYQWLFRKNEYQVSEIGYFVYCNGRADKEAFNGILEFDITLIPYVADDSWIASSILKIHECLNQDIIPEPSEDCDYCRYQAAVTNVNGTG